MSKMMKEILEAQDLIFRKAGSALEKERMQQERNRITIQQILYYVKSLPVGWKNKDYE